MSEYVLDASAVLVLLQGESGHERIASLLQRGAISSVNLAEVAAKLSDRGLEPGAIRNNVEALGLSIIDFDQQKAWRTADLRSSTRRAGLSLGDRACLATAEALKAVAVTSDRAWGRLRLPVQVEVVR